MFTMSLATHVSSCANRQQLVPPLQPCRTRLRRHGALSLQPSLRDIILVAEVPDASPDSSLDHHEPPSAPAQSVSVVPNQGRAVARQLLPRTAAWVLKSAKARLSRAKSSHGLLPLLGAALLLGSCYVMPVAGVLACILLVSGITIMEAFWKKLMPDHLASIKSARAGKHAAQVEGDVAQALCAASAPGLQPLAHAPAEVSAWLRSAKQHIWGALWQPLLDYREEWQEAMTENGPYAWAYDASGISIGQLAPDFTGVQVFADPSTGAIAVVEADMSLDTSKAQDSVLLEVLARGPIGKYAFSLQDARVTGRIRLVPVHKHSLLLVQYVDQPAVQVELSTAYPAMLPHNRTKLLQLEEIEDLLQETLQGVLGSPDVFRLNYQAEFPANMQYAAESAIRAAVAWVTNSRSRLTAALQQCTPLWAAAAAAETTSDSTDIHQQAVHSPDTHSQDQASPRAPGTSSSVSVGDSNAQHAAAHLSTNETSINEPSTNPRNSIVGESAVLALAAQQAAWRQQKPQERSFSTSFCTSMQNSTEINSVPPAASSSSTLSTISIAKQSRADSNGSHSSSAPGPRWQLSSTYSEALECWTASGITARLSAAAAEAAATASPARQDAPAPGVSAAAAALKAQASTGRLLLDPVQAYSRGSSSSGKKSSRVTYAVGRQHDISQPDRAAGTYAVLSTTAASSGMGSGLGLRDFGSLGASCVLAPPSYGAKIATNGEPTASSSCTDSSTSQGDSSTQAPQSSSKKHSSTAATAVAASSSGNATSQVNSSVATRQMQPQLQVVSAAPTAAANAFQAFCSEPSGSPSSLSAGAGAAMALPAPRPSVSWVSIAASVSVVVLGSGILLGSF